VLVAEFVDRLVVDPHVLGELELTHQVYADDERSDAAVHSVIGSTLRKARVRTSRPPDHAPTMHVMRGVTRIQPPRMRTQRHA
jgi:hypothetical protein